MSLAFKDEKALRHLVRTMQDERDTDKARIAELEVKVKGYWASVNQDTVQEYVLAQINADLRERIVKLESAATQLLDELDKYSAAGAYPAEDLLREALEKGE